MQAKTLIDQHMESCEIFQKEMKDTLEKFRDSLHRVNNRMSLMVGGLIIVGKVIDIALPHVHL